MTPYSLAREAVQYLDKGILPERKETIDAFLKRAGGIYDTARQFNPTSPLTFFDARGVRHTIQPEYGYGFNQLPDERVRQLYEADVSWMPVIGVNPEYKSIFNRPGYSGGTTGWPTDRDGNQLTPILISFMPLNSSFNSQVILHERVHGMRDKPFSFDDDLHHEFYAYAAGGNVGEVLVDSVILQYPLKLGNLHLPGIPKPSGAFFRRMLAYADFQRTLQKAGRALSKEFSHQKARYVTGRTSFEEAKEIAGCANGPGLEELLQKKAGTKAGADLRWELLQRKLEGT